MSNFFIVAISFISLSMASLGLIAFLKNKHSYTNKLFLVFSGSLSLWCIFNSLENWIQAPILATTFLRLDFFLGPFVFFFTLLFLMNFPEPNKKFNNQAIIFLIPTLFVSILAMTNAVIKDISFSSGKIGFELGKWFFLYASVLLINIIGALVFQIIQYKRHSGIKKMQIRYVLLGFIITSATVLVFNLFLQNIVSEEVYAIGSLSPLILVSCIFYAIVRYHLMDIWVILRLGTAFTLLLSSIIFIYVLASYFLVSFLGIGYPWSYIIPSFVITAGFIPLKELIERATDSIFFKGHYKFSRVINQVEESIHEAGLDLDKTLEIVNRTITSALKVDRGAILILIPKDHFISRQTIGASLTNPKLKQDSPIINYLNTYKGKVLDREYLEREAYDGLLSESSANDLKRELDRDKLALAVPIEFKDKLIGVYLLGPKLSQDPFSEEDFRLLQHVAWEVSFAIDNAKSYEELKRLDEAKSNFISVVSHQLRTPVTVSRCNLELYFDQETTPSEKEEAVKAAYEGSILLGRQLDQLITVLEIEESNVVINKAPVKIKSLLDDVISSNKVNIKNKNIKLSANIEEPLPDVRCDEGKVKKVLDIMLVNAISYVFAEGHIEISVKKASFNKKEKLIISFSDNGVGVQEASKAEIFKKFFRSPEAISMSPNGFGLGLFIAKKIVRAHGGDVWMEAKEERGATFYFSLPI